MALLSQLAAALARRRQPLAQLSDKGAIVGSVGLRLLVLGVEVGIEDFHCPILLQRHLSACEM
jgi:hypothetical protein